MKFGGELGGYSKEEFRKKPLKKGKKIKTTELDIKEADLKIKKVEQELQSETVTSTVKQLLCEKSGDPAKEVDSDPLLLKSLDRVFTLKA